MIETWPGQGCHLTQRAGFIVDSEQHPQLMELQYSQSSVLLIHSFISQKIEMEKCGSLALPSATWGVLFTLFRGMALEILEGRLEGPPVLFRFKIFRCDYFDFIN